MIVPETTALNATFLSKITTSLGVAASSSSAATTPDHRVTGVLDSEAYIGDAHNPRYVFDLGPFVGHVDSCRDDPLDLRKGVLEAVCAGHLFLARNCQRNRLRVHAVAGVDDGVDQVAHLSVAGPQADGGLFGREVDVGSFDAGDAFQGIGHVDNAGRARHTPDG